MRPPKQAVAPPAPEGPERSGGPAGLAILSREEWRAAPGENRLAGRLRAETPSVPLSPSCWDGPSLWRPRCRASPPVPLGRVDWPRRGQDASGLAVSQARRGSRLAREGALQRTAAARDGAPGGPPLAPPSPPGAPSRGQGHSSPARDPPSPLAGPAIGEGRHCDSVAAASSSGSACATVTAVQQP